MAFRGRDATLLGVVLWASLVAGARPSLGQDSIFDDDFEGGTCLLWSSIAAAETCDGADNDCDGTADNGDPGGGESCDTGQAGVCANGLSHCSGGSLVCASTYSPMSETCNALDDDCDGKIDDEVDGEACLNTNEFGACAGITECHGGKGLECVGPEAAPETCNDFDDDCDGEVDENWPELGNACGKSCVIDCKIDGSGTECVCTSQPLFSRRPIR